MGLEAKCSVRHAGRKSEGKAHLESETLEFRGEFKLKIPLGEITSAEAKRGELVVESAEGRAVFALGRDAEKWALKIRYPKSRIEKLGVKAGQRVSIDGVNDAEFDRDLAEVGADVSARLRKDSDFIFFGVESEAELTRLKKLKSHLNDAGAVWIVYPKGVKHITEAQVRSAIDAAGLVDVKVCSFSDTHTALKAVIPVARRAAR